MQRSVFLQRRTTTVSCELSEESSNDERNLCNQSKYNLATTEEISGFVSNLDFDNLRLNAALLSTHEVLTVLGPSIENFGVNAIWLLLRISVINSIPQIAYEALERIAEQFKAMFPHQTHIWRTRALMLLHNIFIDIKGQTARLNFVTSCGIAEVCTDFACLSKHEFFWLKICDEFLIAEISDDTLVRLRNALEKNEQLLLENSNSVVYPSARRLALQFVLDMFHCFSMHAITEFVGEELNINGFIGRRTSRCIMELLYFLLSDEANDYLIPYVERIDAFVARHMETTLESNAISLILSATDSGIQFVESTRVLVRTLAEMSNENLESAIYALHCVTETFPVCLREELIEQLETLEQLAEDGNPEVMKTQSEINALLEEL